MFYILKKQGKQILKYGWKALAIRYSDGFIRFMFGLGEDMEEKIRKIFKEIQPVSKSIRLRNWE